MGFGVGKDRTVFLKLRRLDAGGKLRLGGERHVGQVIQLRLSALRALHGAQRLKRLIGGGEVRVQRSQKAAGRVAIAQELVERGRAVRNRIYLFRYFFIVFP